MKKTLSILMAGVLLAGTLVALIGCTSEIKDEALIETIYEAIEATEITQFEAKCTMETNYKSNSLEGTINSKNKQKITIAARETDGGIYADIFTDSHSQTKSKSAANKVTTTEDDYAMSFVRGNETYSATGEWKKVSAKKGDFTALLEELFYKDKPLSGTYGLPSDFSVGTEEVQSFCEIAREVDAVAYKSGRGYLVKIDAEKAVEHADAEFLEELLGVENKEGGKFDGDISIRLDDNYNVTAVDVEIGVSLTENTSSTSTMSMRVELDMEIKVLLQAPELCSLMGLKADMGYRVTPGEYIIEEDSASLYTETFNSIYGSYYGTATVTGDNKLIVEVTFAFEEDGTTYEVTERREHDLGHNNYDMDDLFAGRELPNGKTVSVNYSGISYNFTIYPSYEMFTLSIDLQEVEIPAGVLIKNL